MNFRPLGTTGLNVSAIGLGGWMTFGHTVGTDAATAIIRAAVDAGVTFIDVADSYAKGEAERAVGRCLGQGVPRDRLVIASKVFWPTGDPPNPNDRGLARDRILRQIEFSLHNLRTDFLDVYFAHNWDPATPVEETVGTMDGLIRAGKVRHWGISNWPHRGVDLACTAAARSGLRPPALVQPGYNLLQRDIERWLLPTIARHGLSLVTYSPLAGGLLAGGIAREGDLSAHRRDQARHRGVGDEAMPAVLEKVRRLDAIASRLGCRPSQVAIAWLATRPFISSVITGASSEAQVRENVASAEVEIDPESMRELADIFPAASLGPSDLLRLVPMLRRPSALREYLRWRDPRRGSGSLPH